jgi:hypothetical protein
MIVSILIGLTLILSTFVSTVSIVQKIAYAQARMEPSNNGVPVPNFMTQRSIVVGSSNEPGRNFAVQGAGGALSSHGPSITNGPQIFAQGSQYSRTETPPSTASKLGIAHAQGIVRDPEFDTTQGVTGALSSDGRSITNGPQTFAQGAHSVDINKVFQKISKVVFAIGFLEGLALVALGIAKLKAHKENPQQTPLSVPLSLLGLNGLCPITLSLPLCSHTATP